MLCFAYILPKSCLSCLYPADFDASDADFDASYADFDASYANFDASDPDFDALDANFDASVIPAYIMPLSAAVIPI